jgi:hypothetical protein
MFEGESIETRAKNQSRTNIKGSTNSTNNFSKTKFENQNGTCRRTSRSAKTKFEN